MVERLFVYGTLARGAPNEHLLEKIGGSWKTGSVTGTLRPAGWGAAMGCPGIDLQEWGNEVRGFLFSSENLTHHWVRLDEFEGEAYERVVTRVRLEDDTKVHAYIYALRR